MSAGGQGTGGVRRSAATKLLQILVILLIVAVLVALSLLLVYAWLVMTDSLGTFSSTTDVADLDGDGDQDVALYSLRTESEFTAFGGATRWINQGDGQFVAESIGNALGETGFASATGDVDGDGDVDLVIYSGAYNLRVWLDQGGIQGGKVGVLERAWWGDASGGHNQLGSILLGDLNGDGQADGIVVGCCGRVFTLDADDDTPNFSWMWISEWDGYGMLVSRSIILSVLEGLAVSAAALGDLDGDGDLDLFAGVIAPEQGRNRNPADRVLFNDGAGDFTGSGQRLGDSDSTAVALGDLDGDGDLDAFVGTTEGVTVWINQGGDQDGNEGTFLSSEQKMRSGQARTVLLSDLDGDGDLDVLTAGNRRATLWWNDGQAAFARSSQRFRYSKRHGLAIGDFDGDGWPDVFAAAGSTDCRVWLNRGDGTFQSARRSE